MKSPFFNPSLNQKVDTDGDGQSEVIVLVHIETLSGIMNYIFRELTVLDRADNNWYSTKLRYDESEFTDSSYYTCPATWDAHEDKIYDVKDITGDGMAEIVRFTCRGSEGFLNLEIHHWNGEKYENIFTNGDFYHGSFEINDDDRNGVSEIYVVRDYWDGYLSVESPLFGECNGCPYITEARVYVFNNSEFLLSEYSYVEHKYYVLTRFLKCLHDCDFAKAFLYIDPEEFLKETDYVSFESFYDSIRKEFLILTSDRTS